MTLHLEGFLRMNTERGQNKGDKNYSSTVCYLWLNSPISRLEINLDKGDNLGKYSQDLLEKVLKIFYWLLAIRKTIFSLILNNVNSGKK